MRPDAARELQMDFSRFFIDRPIFAAVLSIVIFAAGLIAIPQLPISEYPEVVPPTVQVRAVYPGANPKVIAETVATPLEEAINGVEDMMYMKSVAGSDGVLVTTVTFTPGHRSRPGPGAGAEPRQPGAGAAARGRAPPGRDHAEALADPDHGRAPAVAGRQVRFAVPAQLRHAEGQGRAVAAARRGPGRACSAPATTRCACGWIRTRSPRAA